MGNACSTKKQVEKVDASQAQTAGETVPLLGLEDEFYDKEAGQPDQGGGTGGGGYGTMPVDDRRRGGSDSERGSRRGGSSRRRGFLPSSPSSHLIFRLRQSIIFTKWVFLMYFASASHDLSRYTHAWFVVFVTAPSRNSDDERLETRRVKGDGGVRRAVCVRV